MNSKTGQWEDTFSILTSDANGKMGEIHDRQPVIFDLPGASGVCGVACGE
jgi:putative SOS response-associated peptidase YedK